MLEAEAGSPRASRRDKSHDATDDDCCAAMGIAPQPLRQPDYAPPYKTWGKSRSLRLRDFDYTSPGVVYHVTIGTDRKQGTLTYSALNQQVASTLKESAKLCGYSLIAYCIMPDHLHILIQAGGHPKDLGQFVRGFKSYCSVALRNIPAGSVATPVATKTNSQLWQRGFHEHILRREENIAEVVEYILNNPVRKGLVQDAEQYEWSELITDVERRDRSHDATDGSPSSVASPDATGQAEPSAAVDNRDANHNATDAAQ